MDLIGTNGEREDLTLRFERFGSPGHGCQGCCASCRTRARRNGAHANMECWSDGVREFWNVPSLVCRPSLIHLYILNAWNNRNVWNCWNGFRDCKRQPGGFRDAEHEVQILNRHSGCAFSEIVETGHE